MKKSVVLAVLCLGVGAISSFGTGSIRFDSYLANNSAGIQTDFWNGVPVGAGYSADLLWSLTPITEAAGEGALTAGWNVSGSGAPSLYNVATPFLTGDFAGYFVSGFNFELNPYTPGTTVYFEVIAFQTAAGSYANSMMRGHSASFSATLATGINLPPVVSFAPFIVGTPEPTTPALAGLGGLSFLLLRRKQA